VTKLPEEAAAGRWPGRATADDRSLPPEARAVQGLRAGPVTRGLANGVDCAIVVIVLMVCGATGVVILGALGREADFSPLVLLGLSGATAWLYLTLSWTTVGSTYGQSLLGLRVVSRHGTRLRLVTGVARAALCVCIPWAWFWLLISPRKLTLIDMLVGSRVVYHWKHGH
jgi:uncharacterized RDD family membrane protein YckC